MRSGDRVPGRSSFASSEAAAPALVLAGVLIVLGWAIVVMPGPVPLVLVAGGAAAAAWTLRRSSAVYTLALIIPYGLSYEVLGLDGVGPVDGVLLMGLVVVAVSLVEDGGSGDRFGLPLGKVLLGFWLLMVIWSSLTFLLGPANRDIFKDPVRDTWYLYRGVWRDFLVFPVVVLCLADRTAAKKALALTVIASSLVSVYAIVLSWQTGEPAVGPFSSKNGLAGFLVLILPFAMARVILEKRLQSRLLYGCAAFIMLRALWLTASRGGLAAFLVSLTPFLLILPPKRLLAAAMAGVLVLLVLIGVKGNVLDRPNVQRYLTLVRFSEEGNYRWRQEQWRIFMYKIAERPWLGSGSEVVEHLEMEGRLPTAHNGYLAMAMRSGIPATAAWVVLLLFLMGLSLNRSVTVESLDEKSFWIGLTGLVLAWSCHSLVDNVLLMSEAQRLFWLMVGIALVETCQKRDISLPNSCQPGASR